MFSRARTRVARLVPAHLARWGSSAALALPLAGCMALTPQLPPTDLAALEQISDRDAREQAYNENAITVHDEAQGLRYTKGTDPAARKRSWQSLDAVLRSDRTASETLPHRPLRVAKVLTAMAVIGAITTVAGIAASAREGLNFKDLTPQAGILLGGGLATAGFAIGAGIAFGRARKGYAHAVEIYNESLAMRLGLRTPDGAYIPPPDALVDENGSVLLGPAPEDLIPTTGPGPGGVVGPPAVTPSPASPAAPPAEPAPPPTPPPAGEGTPPVQRPSTMPDVAALSLRPRG